MTFDTKIPLVTKTSKNMTKNKSNQDDLVLPIKLANVILGSLVLDSN